MITPNNEGKNRGGRPKGTRNKVSNTDKLFWQRLLKRQRKRIEEELKGAKGIEFLTAIIRMNEFVMPKQRSTDATIQVDSMSEEQLDSILNKIMSRNGK